MTTRRVFAITFLLLFVMIGAQSFGTPRGAGPDEAAHLVRAGGVVRGDVLGDVVGDEDAIRAFDVPSWVGQPDPACYAFSPETPASCAAITARTGPAVSTAGSYQVWAHVLPGLGTLLPGGATTLWISRLLGALIPAGLIAAALTQLVGRERRLEAASVLLALTPMAIFSIAVVNPSGMAIGGAVAMWVAGLGLSTEERASGALFAAGWAALILSRSDGFVWCAVISAIVLVSHRFGVRGVLAMLTVRAKAAMLGSTVLAAVWSLAVRPELIGDPEIVTGRALLTKIVGRTGAHLREAIGVVGWLDTPIPTTMIYLWVTTVGVLLGAAVLHGRRRDFEGLAVTVAALVVGPWLFDFVQAARVGLFWQGRYGLPLLIGVVILMGRSAARLSDSLGRERLARVVGTSTWLVWNVSFLQEIRRWSVGGNGTMAPWNWNVGLGVGATMLIAAVHIVASAALIIFAVLPSPGTSSHKMIASDTAATVQINGSGTGRG